jgi:hypothetical protein
MTEIEIIRTAPPKKKVIHKVGNFYRENRNHELYQLTQGRDNVISLIQVESGLLFDDLKVNDPKNITNEEFSELVGYTEEENFYFVEKVQITYELA